MDLEELAVPGHDQDEADLDLVVELVRRALDRGDDLSPSDQVLYLTHGRPVVAMMDGLEAVDMATFREHLRALGDDPDLVDLVLGPDDRTAAEAIARARTLRLGRVWGRPHPGDD